LAFTIALPRVPPPRHLCHLEHTRAYRVPFRPAPRMWLRTWATLPDPPEPARAHRVTEPTRAHRAPRCPLLSPFHVRYMATHSLQVTFLLPLATVLVSWPSLATVQETWGKRAVHTLAAGRCLGLKVTFANESSAYNGALTLGCYIYFFACFPTFDPPCSVVLTPTASNLQPSRTWFPGPAGTLHGDTFPPLQPYTPFGPPEAS
jgi:hypothetical protein